MILTKKNKPLQTVKIARHVGLKLRSFNPIVTAIAIGEPWMHFRTFEKNNSI